MPNDLEKKQGATPFVLRDIPLKTKKSTALLEHGEKMLAEAESANGIPVQVTKQGKNALWLLMKKRAKYLSATVETYCGELNRLIIGVHQPKYRATNTGSIITKKIEGFKPFAKTPLDEKTLANNKFAAAIVSSYFLEEADLHNYNIGVDAAGNVIRIDFDRSLYSLWKQKGHPLTADRINNLPSFGDQMLPRDPHWWLPNHVRLAIQKNEQFIRDKFKYLLKIALLNRTIFENIALDHLKVGEERYVDHIEERRKQLAATLNNMPEFRMYLAENSETYLEELEAEFKEYNQEAETKIKKFDIYLQHLRDNKIPKEIADSDKYPHTPPQELIQIFEGKKAEYINRLINIEDIKNRYQEMLNKIRSEDKTFCEKEIKAKRRRRIKKAEEKSIDVITAAKAQLGTIKDLIAKDQKFIVRWGRGKEIQPQRIVSHYAAQQWQVIADAEKGHLHQLDAMEDVRGLAKDALANANYGRHINTTEFYRDVTQKYSQSPHIHVEEDKLEEEAREQLQKLEKNIRGRQWVVGFWGGKSTETKQVVPERVYKQLQTIKMALSRESKTTCVAALSKIRRLAREALADSCRTRDDMTNRHYQETARLSAFLK